MSVWDVYRAEREAGLGKPCPYCSETMDRIRSPSRDHVHPRSKGGSDHPSNILIVCKFCNNDKADYTLGQFYGMMIATEDPRAKVVELLMEDAAEFSFDLGADLYADAGLIVGKHKRLGTSKKRATLRELRRSDSVSGEELNRQWIVVSVMQKLGIPPEFWSLSDKGKVVSVVLDSKTERFGVASTDKLENQIVLAKLRNERERIDVRPKVYISLWNPVSPTGQTSHVQAMNI